MSEHVEKKTILNLYGALAASLILSVLPYPAAAVLSLLFFIGVLIAGYSVRRKAETDSLTANHATFIIRTLWIATFISLITTAAATVYLLGVIDYAPFQSCADALAAKGLEWMESATTMEIYAVIKPCVSTFISGNKIAFLNSVVIAGLPIILYMLYRLAKGVSRAHKGYRLQNEKSWF